MFTKICFTMLGVCVSVYREIPLDWFRSDKSQSRTWTVFDCYMPKKSTYYNHHSNINGLSDVLMLCYIKIHHLIISKNILFTIIKAMVFPVVMYGCESWTVKKAERQRIDAFELWC